MDQSELQDTTSAKRPGSHLTLIAGLICAALFLAVVAWLGIFSYRTTLLERKMSEGIAGVGSIRTAFRVYAAGHNNQYPVLTSVDGTGLSVLGVTAKDLDGKYFKARDYKVTSAAATYTIRATLPGGGPNDFYEIDGDNIDPMRDW